MHWSFGLQWDKKWKTRILKQFSQGAVPRSVTKTTPVKFNMLSHVYPRGSIYKAYKSEMPSINKSRWLCFRELDSRTLSLLLNQHGADNPQPAAASCSSLGDVQKQRDMQITSLHRSQNKREEESLSPSSSSTSSTFIFGCCGLFTNHCPPLLIYAFLHLTWGAAW